MKSKWIGLQALMLAAALLAGIQLPAPALADRGESAPPEQGVRVVYRGAALIDGSGAGLRQDMAVVTDGATIEAVLPSRGLTPEMMKGAELIDLQGRYLLPGLIDSHQHLATPPDRHRAEALMRRDLHGGITAVRVMADDLRSIAELGRASLVGEIAGPDLYFAALVAGPGFFQDPRTKAIAAGAVPGEAPWMQKVDDTTNIPLTVAAARGTFATGLKIYADLPPRLTHALTEEAHRQGLRVWAHGMVFPTPPAQVIEAGPDVISHICYLAYQVSDKRPQTYKDRFPVDYSQFGSGDNPAMASLFREMRRKGIILDATLRVYAEMDRRAAEKPGGPPYHCTADLATRLTRQAMREGVTISAGTDGFTSREDPYSALHEELELLGKAGMPPLQVIRSATSIGAMTIGKADRMGTVETGKLANFVVVGKNPLDNLANLRTVLFTVKRGRRFDRDDYRPIGPEEVSDE